MKIAIAHWLALALLLTAASAAAAPPSAFTGPVELRVDSLPSPLGIDDPAPSFSWQLHDPARGARQTAYQLQIASRPERLGQNKPDIWDSGRIVSAESVNVRYAGPAVAPGTRYFWRVKLWNASGKPYPTSQPTWFETGLLTADAWRAQWIGFETAEESAVRTAPSLWIASPDAKALAREKAPEQRFAYRATVTLAKPVLHAALFATAQDTVSAWLNGAPVLVADKLPPWQQMPWKKFVRADVTAKLAPGVNTIAIEAVHYVVNPNGMAGEGAPPMMATLVVEYADGTWSTFATDPQWKTAVHAPLGWQQSSFDDSAWKNAAAFAPDSASTDDPLGHPWIPDSVKALRNTFAVAAPIKSARLYATSLGAYELFLNGKRVGDDLLDPGWTDYRQRVKYQTYDVTAQLATGPNAIAALLAPGWYETPLEWFQQPNNYGDTPPALRAQLRIEHTDGSVEWVATDATWQAGTSFILHSEIYDGETQDARLVRSGWDTAAFDARLEDRDRHRSQALGHRGAGLSFHSRRARHSPAISQPSPSPASTSSTSARTSPASSGFASRVAARNQRAPALCRNPQRRRNHLHRQSAHRQGH